MQSLDYRNAKRAEFRQKVFGALQGMRGHSRRSLPIIRSCCETGTVALDKKPFLLLN